MDAAEIALVRTSFEGALRDAPGVRGVPGSAGDGIAALLAKLGWHELHEAEPAVAVGELFEAQGRLLVATPALDLAVAAALGLVLPDGAAVVHPGLASPNAAPGLATGAEPVTIDGVVLAGTARADALLVPARQPDGALLLAEVAPDEVECTPAGGLDEDLRLARVRGRVQNRAGTPLEPAWPVAAAAARRALAHELVGLAQQMLDDAARHVTDRVQFGRPVATFQAVRHRLADVHVAVASVRPVLQAAWGSDDPLAADAAKVLAGRAALLAAQHCLQVTGAIGFTWEHDLHRRIRRVHVLDGLYGSARTLVGQIGARLLNDRTVPRLGVMAP